MSEMATLDTAKATADAVSRFIDQCLPAESEGQSVEDVVAFARHLWFVVRRTWQQFQLRLEQGLGVGQARHAAASAALACDSLLRMMSKLEAVRAQGTTGTVEGLAGLMAAAPEVRAIYTAARRLVDQLNAPEPPIDEARLAEGLTAAERGAFEDTAAIVERLKAGGEL
jgi:hypothetical protein